MDLSSSTGSWPVELPGLALARDLVNEQLSLGRDVCVANLELAPYTSRAGAATAGASDLLFEALEETLTDQFRSHGCAISRIAAGRHIAVFGGMPLTAAERVLTLIIEHWNEGVTLGTSRVTIDITAGLSASPVHGSNADDLLRRASAALRAARRGGAAQLVYRDGMEEAQARRLMIRRDLAQAIADRHLALVYQPQMSLRTKRIRSFEGLVRWNHPELGDLSPGEFVPIAEESGQIAAVTARVIQSAVMQLAQWSTDRAAFSVAVNLSALDLENDALEDVVVAALRQHDVDGRRLTLELTEHAIVADLDRAAEAMRRLTRHGVSFSLDDFGTGHASLRTLRSLPLAEIKVDRSFTRDLRQGAPDELIVSSAVSLAHALRLQVVAEGVENAAALIAVSRLRCDRAQGYFVGRPAPAVRPVAAPR